MSGHQIIMPAMVNTLSKAKTIPCHLQAEIKIKPSIQLSMIGKSSAHP
jgi:hypothetical protein